MSRRVLIIPENPTNDQHILKPVVEALFDDLGQNAKITVLQEPHIHGIEQALDPAILTDVFDIYATTDLFLLIVDRDGELNRVKRFDRLRELATSRTKTLIGCLAIEELEVWALALYKDELSARWPEVRSEVHVKERHFQPLAESKGWQTAVGGGRKHAMRQLKGNWRSLKSLCSELQELQAAIEG